MRESVVRVGEAQARPRWLRGVLIFVLVLFVGGGLVSGYLFYGTVRALVASGDIPSFPNLSFGGQNAQPTAGPGTAEAVPQWSHSDRINVLLLGVDQRPGETGPVRTDTMMVLTLDPETKTGGLLSLPRDLWVNIPTVGEDRINTANVWGEENDYPGGGPALAMKTVTNFLGIPIHAYVRVDFQGFKKLIDTIGGVDIDVATPIDDMEYPTDDYGIEELHIPAGRIHMDGDLALKYARSRHGSNDLDRAGRQQQVLSAAADKALSLNLLPKAPALIATLLDSVKTDLQPLDLLALVRLGMGINKDQIKSAVISYDMIIPTVTPGGAQVLVPIREKVRLLVDDIFTTPKATTINRIAAEAAKIEVLNGAGTVGMAAQVSAYLKEQGLNVVTIDNADRGDYAATVIINRGKPYTTDRVAELMRVDANSISTQAAASDKADITVIVGRDFSIPGNP